MNWITALILATTGGERAELLIALVEANGCRMSGQEATEILPQHDFTQQETQRITADLFSEGLIRIDRQTDTLILRTEECK